ncbi:Schwannomin interacting protein 1 [Trinorchestia longiramus]|nr:Schwannomin interacting protein 1 [Trinorchestia longiramus]
MWSSNVAPVYPSRMEKPNRNLSSHTGLSFAPPSFLNLSRLTSSVSFDSFKTQADKMSAGVLSSLKDGSEKVSQFMRNVQSPEYEHPAEMRFPSIFEQLKWPNLSLDARHHPVLCDGEEDEEEDIVDKFVRVIQAEDKEEKAEQTFYNHPARRRNDREEIRRRLAMGAEEEMEEPTDHRKLSLQTRLQTGMNLQICFMNETASDSESQCSDTESAQDHRIDYPKSNKGLGKSAVCMDFATRQTQLQAEARLALSQAKDMARMQMEVDRQKKRCSPVTSIIRDSFSKIGMTFPDNKRRLSRQLLTDMNVAQLQVIVNHLHTQIEGLNEELVQHLLSRDDLHMEQDSRLVDIEDLSNHLAAKERSNSTTSSGSKSSPTSCLSTPSSASRSPPSTTTSASSPPQSATGLSSASPTSPLSSGEAERLRLAFSGPAVASK